MLGFPCNQFGAQEPGSNSEIAAFCQLNYGVSFPMMGKIDFNGKDGSVRQRYAPTDAPESLAQDIETALND